MGIDTFEKYVQQIQAHRKEFLSIPIRKVFLFEETISYLFPEVASRWSNDSKIKPWQVIPGSSSKCIIQCRSCEREKVTVVYRAVSRPDCHSCALGSQKAIKANSEARKKYYAKLENREKNRKAQIKAKAKPASKKKRYLQRVEKFKNDEPISVTHPTLAGLLRNNPEWVNANTIYSRSGTKIYFSCEDCGVTTQKMANFAARNPVCRDCLPTRTAGKSYLEKEIAAFLVSNNFDFTANDRKTIRNNTTKRYLELDFLLSEQKIAIEINGDYWHSDSRFNYLKSDNFYRKHRFKKILCEEKQIKLLQLWEKDWTQEREKTQEDLLEALLNPITPARFTRLISHKDVVLTAMSEGFDFIV